MNPAGTPRWVSIAELARRRSVSYQAIRQMIRRAERASGRRYVTSRRVHDARGRLRWLRGIETDRLMGAIQSDHGEAPPLPEVVKLNRRVSELTALIHEIKEAARRHDLNR